MLFIQFGGVFMKIEEFIGYMNLNSKDKLQYEKIIPEFKKLDLEKFLFLKSSEEMTIWPIIEKAIKEFKNKPMNTKVNALLTPIIEQLNYYNDENLICLFFSYTPTKNYYIACEIAKRSYKHIILKNLFEDDTSINHMVVFKKNQKEDIALLLDTIKYTMSNNTAGLGGYKIYNMNIIYISEFGEYKKNIICYPKPNILVHFCGNALRRDNNPYAINQARECINTIMEKNIFKSELEMTYYIREKIMTFIQTMYNKAIKLIQGITVSSEERDKIYNLLIQQNRVPVKWKSEKALFDLIFLNYKDAIYQYRPNWLKPQSLDIYIPSINVAFEYQGVQHYIAIEHFGGEESFNKRNELDKKKRALCQENNIKLIEWNYMDAITQPTLKRKLNEIDICVD
jgi:arginine repressor